MLDTIEEVAKLLHGRQYGAEVTRDERKILKENGIVVVFGASDDLMEFTGAIYNEVGGFDGATAYLNDKGLIENECDNYDCPHFEKLKEMSVRIEALWCDSITDIAWTYETGIKHETFDIMEDDGIYCRGIVFKLEDVG